MLHKNGVDITLIGNSVTKICSDTKKIPEVATSIATVSANTALIPEIHQAVMDLRVR